MVVAFRQKTLLPLDDVLGCLRDTIPNLSRSALHRCLQRHGISRLPVEETKNQRKRFKTYEIGYVHIDSCELRHADGKLVMFLAIDRVSKFATSNSTQAPARCRGCLPQERGRGLPLQDQHRAHRQGYGLRRPAQESRGTQSPLHRSDIFDRVCLEHGIEHRLTKPYHPWTNGQAERMNRTIKTPR
jgi:hypothetical protein